MKLTNPLDHPALNQLRLGMDAALVSVEKGWAPRLLNAEKVRLLGRTPSPAQLPQATGGSAPTKSVPKARPPTEYLREKGSKILNPLEPVGGEVDWSQDLPVARPSPAPTVTQAQRATQTPAIPPAPTVAVVVQAPTDSQAARKRRNQDALNRLKDLS